MDALAGRHGDIDPFGNFLEGCQILPGYRLLNSGNRFVLLGKLCRSPVGRPIAWRKRRVASIKRDLLV